MKKMKDFLLVAKDSKTGIKLMVQLDEYRFYYLDYGAGLIMHVPVVSVTPTRIASRFCLALMVFDLTCRCSLACSDELSEVVKLEAE